MSYQTNLINGEKSEVIFMSKCFVDLGYMVSRPIGTTHYDLIVEVDNKCLRVQVKSSHNSTEALICKGTNGNGNKGKGKYPYPEDSIDFFAIHDIQKNEWFIIPRSMTGDSKKIRYSYKKGTKYIKYWNNWEFNPNGKEETII